MSKKNKQVSKDSPASSVAATHVGEYRIIKHDLIRVIVLNVVYLAAILAVYFTNEKTQYLENWFGKVLHF